MEKNRDKFPGIILKHVAHLPLMLHNQDSLQMRGMRPGMGPLWMDRPERSGMPMDRPLLDRIPNLTEKQKKDINDLRQKQRRSFRASFFILKSGQERKNINFEFNISSL
ncbi:MAG: hypothetical protein MUO72_13275 [Bacteroidales bacterium]|nr:hypothetical protein [Bacteroidales bacterium]